LDQGKTRSSQLRNDRSDGIRSPRFQEDIAMSTAFAPRGVGRDYHVIKYCLAGKEKIL
jgi:hypothetical protein